MVRKQKPECLHHKGKHQKPQETRGRFHVGTSITKRPKEIRKRETFSHWELARTCIMALFVEEAHQPFEPL